MGKTLSKIRGSKGKSSKSKTIEFPKGWLEFITPQLRQETPLDDPEVQSFIKYMVDDNIPVQGIYDTLKTIEKRVGKNKLYQYCREYQNASRN